MDTEKNQLAREIKRIQARLSKKRICENFGQKEVRQLRDKYGTSTIYSMYDKKYPLVEMINAFDNWCMNYTGNSITRAL